MIRLDSKLDRGRHVMRSLVSLIACATLALIVSSVPDSDQMGVVSKPKFQDVYATQLDKEERQLFNWGFKCMHVLNFNHTLCVACCAHEGKLATLGDLQENCHCVEDKDGLLKQQLAANAEQASPLESSEQGQSPNGLPPPPPLAPPSGKPDENKPASSVPPGPPPRDENPKATGAPLPWPPPPPPPAAPRPPAPPPPPPRRA